MINYEHQEHDRIPVPGIPDDIKYLGRGLESVAHWTKKVYDALRRQESPNPTVIRLDPGVTFSTTARMRAVALVFTGGTAAENFALKVGAANAVQWFAPVSGAMPMPVVLDAGVDVSVVDVTTPAAVNWRAYLVAYVELEDGNA